MEPPMKRLSENDSFTQDHLNRPPLELGEGLAALKQNIELLNAIAAFSVVTATSYDLCVDVINGALNAVHGAYASAKVQLVCVNVNSKNIRHHPHQHFPSRADFVVLPKDLADALAAAKLVPAYHHILSLTTFLSSDSQSGRPATHSIGRVHLVSTAPKNLPGITPSLSSSTLIRSTAPPADKLHTFFDKTITLVPNLPLKSAPKWDVEVDGVTYANCTVRSVGQPWHRMSWVAETEGGFIIKDQHRSDDSTFTEGELYETLHEAGYALGFADMVSYTQIKSYGQYMHIEVDGVRRTKTRIVLATTGVSIYRCKDLQTFLRVMYDVLEAHRHAVSQKVLHRDLSIANILIKAKSARPRKPVYDKHDRPRFVGEVLDRKEKAEPEALIIDFDNGCRYENGQKTDHNPLHERTGTPKYIARSVSVGKILHLDKTFEPMPELSAELAIRYELAYKDAKDPIRSLKDTGGTIHGSVFDDAKFQRFNKSKKARKTEFQHHPRHDAESVFWCSLAFLMRALPKPEEGEKPEPDTNEDKLAVLWVFFRDHEIPDHFHFHDSRVSLLDDNIEWEDILHPKLAFVSALIEDFVAQIRPEYALLEPPPHQFHLHEAMQRLLLKYTVEWKDQNIAFNTELPRLVPKGDGKQKCGFPALDGQHPTISVGSKRKAISAQLAVRPPSPKVKVEGNDEEVDLPSESTLKRARLRQ
ncbi:hypothetical protein ONZ45_g9652 [Pleurotus djamor]|nr:hypothetical protein ONZ45_g9652 [Pleurotus djamor]